MEEHLVLVSEEIKNVCREMYLKTSEDHKSRYCNFNRVLIIMVYEPEAER